ncbi:hypothetical protein BBJ28_00025137 [Nothophytophthora sp. Chile5]|nr:hypothetical protein BBJ28_00025137 [Nothophytophthora sp. Chile5]
MTGVRGVPVVPLPPDSQDARPPPPPHQRQASRLVDTLTFFGHSLGPLYDVWERLQVSHCGQYSVERMLALEEYGQRASPLRVVAVCVLTPLSPLLVVVLAACLPLQPAAQGPAANYMFWIRHAVVMTLTMISGMLQAKAWLPELPLAPWRMLGISVGSAGVSTAVNVLIAELWVFPIPFMSILGYPAIFIVWLALMALVVGPGALRDIPDADFRVRRYIQMLAAQTSLMQIYPAYQALFLAMPSSVQPLLMLLLPVVNLALKNVLAACGAHLEDRLPEVIVFTVDVFNSLYSVLCMRSTNSLKTVAVVVASNLLDLLLSLHGMHRRSRVALAKRTAQRLLHRQQQRQQSILSETGISETHAVDSMGTLFQATLELLQTPGQLDPAELRQICLLSGAQHNLLETNTVLLAALAARCVYNNERRPTNLRSMAQRKSRYSSVAMSGPELSAEHFVAAPQPRSRLMQRIRAAALVLPAAGKRFSTQITTRISQSLGFRFDSREKLSQDRETNGDSETDSFGTDSPATPLTPLDAPSSRRQSTQPEASRRASSQAPSSRKVSTQMEPSLGSSSNQSGSSRRVSPHMGSSRRMAEIVAVSERLSTSMKLRPLLLPGNPVINDILKETRKQNTIAVNQTLQLLFNNEYIGLIAYTQCITPMIYMVYMAVLQVVPSRSYYMRESESTHPTVLAVFVGLQLVALLSLQVFVAVRFGVSTLYQVAFVLETHAQLVQGKIATWLIFAVGFTLEHYGKGLPLSFLRWLARSLVCVCAVDI